MNPIAANSVREFWNDWVSMWRVVCLAIVTPWDDALRAFSERAGLLPKRMSAVGFDPNAFSRTEPLAFFDLQRRCAACESYERCEWDLTQNPADPGWQDYCLNSAVLMGLTRKPRMRRNGRRIGRRE
jgi:hypothetical protein